MSLSYEYELSVPKQFKTNDKEPDITVMSELLLTEDSVWGATFYWSVLFCGREGQKSKHYSCFHATS